MNTLRFVYRAMTFLLSTGVLLLGASGPAAGQGQLAQSKIAQTLTATDSTLAGGSVGVLLGTGRGSTQQYRVDKFAAQVQ